jgi:hypothetical protein
MSLYLTKHYVMKAYGGLNVKTHVFLTSDLVGDELSVSRPCHFNPRVRTPGTNWIRGWVGPRDCVDDIEE